jgi:hypothetical protein
MNRQELHIKMKKIIEGWIESGISQREWCNKKKIGYSTFYYWYKRYREQVVVTPKPQNSFVHLEVDGRGSSQVWGELIFPDGKKLVLHQQVDVDFIKRLAS